MKADLIKYLRKINKKPSVQGKLLEQFISHGASTIPEMSKAIGVSLPTTTSALNELIKEGFAREIGKKDNSSGRIPMVYDLVPTAGYFIGVNPEMNCLALAASDFAGNLITEKTRVPYVYENSPENLEEISRIINEFIESLPVSREEILQVCVNVAERVNPVQGNAYNMFTKNEDLSLQDILDAIAKEDVLSLATLQRIADELGKQLAGVINIFNPEMLVIGGEMSVTGDYLTLPVKMGIKKFSLNIMNEDSKIVTSSLKGLAGIMGACLMARYRLLNENIGK